MKRFTKLAVAGSILASLVGCIVNPTTGEGFGISILPTIPAVLSNLLAAIGIRV